MKITTFALVICVLFCVMALTACNNEPVSDGYKVGDRGPAGGYIFYDCDADNDSGNADGLISSEAGWRYLEAAPADVRVVNNIPTVDPSSAGYSAAPECYIFGYYRLPGTGNLYVNGTQTLDSSCTKTTIGSGKTNTRLLVDAMGSEAFYDIDSFSDKKTSAYAARLCDTLSYSTNGKTFTDWFLPSADELNLMYKNLKSAGLGGFSDTNNYWASSECEGTANTARSQNFNKYGAQGSNTRGTSEYGHLCVRPVRAF